jgi:hypothetical protein
LELKAPAQNQNFIFAHLIKNTPLSAAFLLASQGALR